MRYFLYLVRKYPVTAFLVAVIWVLSLAPGFPETPLDDVQFIDKWTHITMYGGTFTVLWAEYWRKHNKPDWGKLFRLAWLAPVAMGGVLELLQAYATTTRSGEWLDFAANTAGVTLAAAIGLLLRRVMSRT